MITQHTLYDDNYNIIEYLEKDLDGKILVKIQYNSEGKIIYKKDEEVVWEYDERGNLIFETKIDGRWTLWEFDENDQEIFKNNSQNQWHRSTYHPPYIKDGKNKYQEASVEFHDGHFQLYDRFGNIIKVRDKDTRVNRDIIYDYENMKMTTVYLDGRPSNTEVLKSLPEDYDIIKALIDGN